MRGQPKNTKSLIISGNIYLKYEDDEQLATPEKGDIYLYLNTENTFKTLIKGDYFNKGYAGYFKADIFDGKEWQLLNIGEFFEFKEHHFTKSECSIDTYKLCVELLAPFAGNEVYKGYRGGHYSLHQYEPGIYKGKRGQRQQQLE